MPHKTYKIDSVDLEDIHKVQVEILSDFHRICVDNGLTYQLFAGTLLGAVRHRGFIPWDDDVDVCMLREDYNKLLEICKTKLDRNKYFLQTNKTERTYYNYFARLRKNNTTFIQEQYKNTDIHQGIFIDIFPMDNVPSSWIISRLQIVVYEILRRLFRSVNRYNIGKKSLIKSNPFLTVNKSVLIGIGSLIPKRVRDAICEKLQMAFNSFETEYVNHLTDKASMDWFEKYKMEREDFNNVIEWDFEGSKFYINKDYDRILKRMFGDYRKLPPEEERYPHHQVLEVNLKSGFFK